MYQLQISGQQDGFLPRIVAFGGIIIVLLSVAFLVFMIFSRRHRNRLVLKQRAMQEEFGKQLMQAQMEVQEHTLFQLGQELHDNIGQLLSSTKMLLGITERKLQPAVPDSLITAEDTLGKAINDLRNLTKSLNSEWLHQFNLVENVQVEVERIRTARQIDVSFASAVDMLPLEPEEQVMAFRVVQEAIQNCIKHAGASLLHIDIRLEESVIFLTISDNGQGFDAADAPGNGIGLMNMRHRIRLLGGTISWQSQPGKGTDIQIVLPISTKDV